MSLNSCIIETEKFSQIRYPTPFSSNETVAINCQRFRKREKTFIINRNECEF